VVLRAPVSVNVMLLNRARLIAIVGIAVAHAVLTAVLWLWMAGVTGLGFKDRATWSTLDHAQASVVPTLAQSVSLPGRLLMPLVDSEFGLVVLLLANSTIWAVVLVAGYCWLRARREQHNS
jgi:hypothetical protein